MLLPENTAHQTSLFGTDLLQQLDVDDPLLLLSNEIPWSDFEQAFAKHYSQDTGRPAKFVRLYLSLFSRKLSLPKNGLWCQKFLHSQSSFCTRCFLFL